MNAPAVDVSRLKMPLSEAIFTQRAIRRFKPDPIPMADLRLVILRQLDVTYGHGYYFGRPGPVRDLGA